MDSHLQFVALIQSATDLAVRAHADTTRKSSSVLYVSHPVAVMQILSSVGVTDPVVLAAALLHDVVEDTTWTPSQIFDHLRQGGVEAAERVVAIVLELSEVKLNSDGVKRPWLDRKRSHLEHLAFCSIEALLIKLADCLHNAQTVLLAAQTDASAADRFATGRDQQRWYRLSVANLPSLREQSHTAANVLAHQLRFAQRCLDAAS